MKQVRSKIDSEFVSLATHHIMTPLTGIKSHVFLIQEGNCGKVSREMGNGLEAVDRLTNHLVSTVYNFLEASRIDSGSVKYNYSEFDLKKLLDQIIVECRPLVERMGATLSYNAEDIQIIISADKEKVRHAIKKVIENSIRYTSRGYIKISVSADDSRSLICISDTNTRILPSVPPKLLQKFTSSGNKTEACIMSNDLGLYVAKQFIEAQKGRFWIESAGESKETKFYIELALN